MNYDCEACGAPNCHDYSVKLHINRKHFHCHGGSCRGKVIKKMFKNHDRKINYTVKDIYEIVLGGRGGHPGIMKKIGVSVIHAYAPLKAWE